jgi:serine/threonine-protein phosphatase 6 regulatory ankyrin repeat subunit B
MLLEKGANTEARSNDGRTALLWAAIRHRTAVAQLLLDKGANPDAKANDGDTALIAAACSETEADKEGAEKPGLVQSLLNKGANIDAANKDGLTPMTCPNRMKPPAVADLLEQASREKKTTAGKPQ